MDLIKHKDAGFILCLVLVLVTALSPIQDWIDNALFDRLTISRDQTDTPQPILIDIDDKSLEALGRWPWPRYLHAEMINLLTKAEAKAVGYNIAFIDPDLASPSNDLILREAIAENNNIVLPIIGEYGATLYPFRSPEAPSGSLLGHVEIDVDADGRVRRSFLKAGIDQPIWPAFGLAVLNTEGVLEDSLFPGTRAPHQRMGVNRKWSRDREVLIPRPDQPLNFEHFSFIDVLEEGVPLSTFEGRMVFVGIQATGLEPRFLLPGDPDLNMVSGTTLHANLYHALSQHAVLTPILPIWGLCYAILLTAALYLTLIQLRKYPWLQAGSACIAVAFIALPPAAISFGYWLPSAAALIGLISVSIIAIWTSLSRKASRTRTDRITLLASKQMFEETLALEWEQAERKKTPLSVILLDIDQFKRFTETFGPERSNWVKARIAHILQSHQRRSRDLVARTSAAQFAVILPVTSNAIAYSLAEKMRNDVESLQIEHVKAHQFITISTVILTTSPNETLDMAEWLKQGYTELAKSASLGGNFSNNTAE